MRAYLPALLALAVAGVIEARCSTPGLRPSAEVADRVFHILGRAAFGFWLLLLVWGLWALPWWRPVSGLVASLALNAAVISLGARPWWPGISMGLALVGLFLVAVVFNQAR